MGRVLQPAYRGYQVLGCPSGDADLNLLVPEEDVLASLPGERGRDGDVVHLDEVLWKVNIILNTFGYNAKSLIRPGNGGPMPRSATFHLIGSKAKSVIMPKFLNKTVAHIFNFCCI